MVENALNLSSQETQVGSSLWVHGQSGSHSGEFPDSQGYREKSLLKKQKTKNKNKDMKKEVEGNDRFLLNI